MPYNFTLNGNSLNNHQSWYLMWNLSFSSAWTASLYTDPKLFAHTLVTSSDSLLWLFNELSYSMKFCGTLLTNCTLHHWVWFISRKILARNTRTWCKSTFQFTIHAYCWLPSILQNFNFNINDDSSTCLIFGNIRTSRKLGVSVGKWERMNE